MSRTGLVRSLLPKLNRLVTDIQLYHNKNKSNYFFVNWDVTNGKIVFEVEASRVVKGTEEFDLPDLEPWPQANGKHIAHYTPEQFGKWYSEKIKQGWKVSK